MRGCKQIALAAICAWAGMTGATRLWAAPNLVHQPPLEAKTGKPVTISVMVTDAASPVIEVALFYRAGGTLAYQVQRLNGAGYNYSGQIPGTAVGAGGIDYYLEARNQANETATSPPINPALAPYHLVAREPEDPPRLRLISPAAGSAVKPEDIVIVIAIDSGRSRPDLSTLAVIFDGQNVTSQCRISETMLSFIPPEATGEGLHRLRVSIKNIDGGDSASGEWAFTAGRLPSPVYAPGATPNARAAAFSGALTLESQYAGLGLRPTGVAYFNQPEGWLNRVTLNLNGKLDGWNLLGNIFLTSENQPGRQPVDRVKLEWFNTAFHVTLGDMYPVFSAYSLNNLFVRGGGLALTAGEPDANYSRFELLGGLTRIPIEGRDPGFPGTFEQWLWATRWLYHFLPGTGLAVNYATVNDYANSIQQSGGSYPAHNWAATAEAHVRLPWAEKNFTGLFAEYGLDYYDEEQNVAGVSLGEAWRTGLRWDWSGASFVTMEYKNTGANYVSLANPWLIGDWQGIEGQAQIFFWNNLSLAASGNYWHDNVNGQKLVYEAGGNTRSPTTTTTYLSSQLTYRAAVWLPMLSLGYAFNRQQDDSRPAPRLDNQNTVLTAGLGLQWLLGADPLLANINYSYSQYADLLAARLSPDQKTTSWMGTLMYLLGTQWSFSGGYGLTSNRVEDGVQRTIAYSLWNLRANWKLVPGRFDLGTTWESLNGRGDQMQVDNQLTTLGLNGTCYFTSAQSLGLQLANIYFTDKITDSNSYTEWVVNLRYGVTF